MISGKRLGEGRRYNPMLLDSTIFIDFLRGNAAAKDFLEENENLSTSFLVVMEVVAGLPDKQQAIHFEKFLVKAQIPVLTASEQISRRSYQIFSRNYHRSKVGIVDALIASTAIEYGERLATHNIKHFKLIDELQVERPY